MQQISCASHVAAILGECGGSGLEFRFAHGQCLAADMELLFNLGPLRFPAALFFGECLAFRLKLGALGRDLFGALDRLAFGGFLLGAPLGSLVLPGLLSRLVFRVFRLTVLEGVDSGSPLRVGVPSIGFPVFALLIQRSTSSLNLHAECLEFLSLPTEIPFCLRLLLKPAPVGLFKRVAPPIQLEPVPRELFATERRLVGCRIWLQRRTREFVDALPLGANLLCQAPHAASVLTPRGLHHSGEPSRLPIDAPGSRSMCDLTVARRIERAI